MHNALHTIWTWRVTVRAYSEYLLGYLIGSTPQA